MFDQFPQKNAIILWNEEGGLITDFLVLYDNPEGDNDYVDQKYKSMSYNAGNVFAEWMKWTPAYIILNFLVLERFKDHEFFLQAFDQLMKIEEIRSDLTKVCSLNTLYERMERMDFINRFPWASKPKRS